MNLSKNTLVAFSVTRLGSTTFDSAWLVALPIYFASKGLSETQFSSIVAFQGGGEILGFLALPYLNSLFSKEKSSLTFDILASIIFFVAGVLIVSARFDVLWASIISMLGAIFYSIWFSNSDAFLSSIETQDKVFLQKNLVFSNNVGPTFGAVLGPLIFSSIGLAGIAILNAFSFIMQFVSLKRITEQLTPQLISNPPKKIGLLKTFLVLQQSAIFKYVVISSLAIKLSFVTIPFIILRYKSLGATNLQIICLASAAGLGTLLSLLIPFKETSNLLSSRYFMSTIGTVTASLVSIKYTYYESSFPISTLMLLIMGLSFGQYLVTFRLLRQHYENAEDIPYLNSSGGLLARLILPFGAIIIPLLSKGYVYFITYAAMVFLLTTLAGIFIINKTYKLGNIA